MCVHRILPVPASVTNLVDLKVLHEQVLHESTAISRSRIIQRSTYHKLANFKELLCAFPEYATWDCVCCPVHLRLCRPECIATPTCILEVFRKHISHTKLRLSLALLAHPCSVPSQNTNTQTHGIAYAISVHLRVYVDKNETMLITTEKHGGHSGWISSSTMISSLRPNGKHLRTCISS